MSILSLPKMVISSEDGWPDVERARPSIVKLFTLVALPLAILPPAMLYYAGTEYGDVFADGFRAKPWGEIAFIFFLAELATFGAMGWFIKQVADVRKVNIDYHDAYLLAGVAPIPLWLSSLGLLVPSLSFNAGVSVVALAMSCGLIYHGVYALCHLHDEMAAVEITYGVIAAGLVAWALLLVFVMLF